MPEDDAPAGLSPVIQSSRRPSVVDRSIDRSIARAMARCGRGRSGAAAASRGPPATPAPSPLSHKKRTPSRSYAHPRSPSNITTPDCSALVSSDTTNLLPSPLSSSSGLASDRARGNTSGRGRPIQERGPQPCRRARRQQRGRRQQRHQREQGQERHPEGRWLKLPRPSRRKSATCTTRPTSSTSWTAWPWRCVDVGV
jgi:hypothetical protein